MTNCFVTDVRFCYLLHSDCGLNTHITAQLFQRISQRQRIHNSCKHTDMVCTGAFHFTAAATSPEVTTANNDGDFHTQVVSFFDAMTNFSYLTIIQTGLFIACKSFTAQLQQNTTVCKTHLYHSLLFLHQKTQMFLYYFTIMHTICKATSSVHFFQSLRIFQHMVSE